MSVAEQNLTDRITYLEEGDWAEVTEEGARFHDAQGRPVERAVRVTALTGAGLLTAVGLAFAALVLVITFGSLLAAGMLMLTPLAFLFSTARNCRELADVIALVLGLLLFPLAAMLNSGVDILVSGVVAGTVAYGVHRARAGTVRARA